MKIQDYVLYGIKSMRMRSLRSWLTIIGVIIGVISMFVITSVAEGVNAEVSDLLSAFGPNVMFVVPVNIEKAVSGGFSGGVASRPLGKLYQRDVDSINSIPGVDKTSRVLLGRSSLEFREKQITSNVIGSDASVFEIFGDFFRIEKGRVYSESERRVAVLGNDAANKLFGKDKVDVGNSILIDGKTYKVVGVMKKLGTSPFTAHDDAAIFVPFDEGKDLFKSQLAKDEVFAIYIEISQGFDANDIKSLIDDKIASNHHVTLDDKDFTVITSDFIKETVSSILNLLDGMLIAITLVATVVGAIGISNTMFMSVMERTGEIGVLKAIGSSERDIQLIFLTESAMIGLAGGLIGLIIAVMILYVAGDFGVPYLIRIRWVLFVFAFSIGIGVLAGWVPARNASKMDPVEALGR